MRLRTILMSSALLLSIVASMSFGKSRDTPLTAHWIYVGPPGTGTQCLDAFPKLTNESNCEDWHTGPVCTVTPSGRPTTTAYSPYDPGCVTPWRQP